MTEGRRPGGLTALAVFNFIFGGFNVLGMLGMTAALVILSNAAANEEIEDEEMRRAIEAWQETGVGVFYALLALMAVTAFLLIASGVGYLKQKRTLGRGFGNAYALLSIVVSLIYGLAVSADAGGGFELGTIAGLVYPVLTLLLLNTTFKEDFTR